MERLSQVFFLPIICPLSIHFFRDQIIFIYHSLATIRVTTALRNIYVYIEENNTKILYSFFDKDANDKR